MTRSDATPATRPEHAAYPIPLRQYDLRTILAVWAAAAVPMGLLSWLVVPVLGRWFGGAAGLPKALLLCLTAGLAWQFVLVAVLVRREVGSWRWPALRDALWLRAPLHPVTGRRGGRVWWAVVPPVLAFGLLQLIPGLRAPTDRDLGAFLGSEAGRQLFAGSWLWFAVVVAMAVCNTVLGEELLFRGLLLPRMQAVFGSRSWLANGVLFGCYHLHMPWAVPQSICAGMILAYPSARHRSAWLGIAVHSVQSVIIVAATLALVLR